MKRAIKLLVLSLALSLPIQVKANADDVQGYPIAPPAGLQNFAPGAMQGYPAAGMPQYQYGQYPQGAPQGYPQAAYPPAGMQGYPASTMQGAPPAQMQGYPAAALQSGTPDATPTPPAASASGKAPFQLGAQESHVIQPIPQDLQQGQIWDEGLVQKYKPALSWVRIPTPFAGTWQSSTARTLQEELFQNGQWYQLKLAPGGIVRKNAETITRGYQQDANGGIWHCVGAEHESRVEGDDELVIYMKRGVQMQVLSPTKVQRYVSSVAVSIAHKNNKIKKSFYQEERMIQTVSPDGRQFQTVTEVTRGTNPYQPEAHGVMEEVCDKIGEFHPVDSLGGIDLKQSFNDYLHNHHLDNLIVGNGIPASTDQ